ncbi:MAG: TRAP transporter substrate-binding protein [Spirochaetales bacterium]|nr:TRAP transporter substrate-binding protein [Spirochaetales bacterium]
MNKNVWLVLAVLVLAVGGLAAEGASEEPQLQEMTLRMGLISSENHPITLASKRFADTVNQKTDGRVTIQVVPAGALGGEIEMHDMIASKTLDLGCFGSGVPSSYNPEFQILLMPYLWKDWETMVAFSKSPVMDSMNEKYTAKSKVRVLASNWNQGERVTLSKKPINSIADFKGLKIRVPQLPSWMDMWKLVGANPTPIPFPEVYSALQQGVVDAIENPFNFMYTSSFYEQAKYLVRTNHVMYFNMIFMNDELFQSMGEEYQEIFLEAAVEAGDYHNQLVQADLKDIEGKLLAGGVSITDIDLQEMRRLMLPLYDKWESQFGAEIRAKIAEFQAAR